MPEVKWDIKGKVCLVTGANSGIGLEAALALVKQGAGRLILACRNMETGKEAVNYIREQAGITDDKEASERLALRNLDLSSLESIRKFAKQINDEEKQLHVLVNNAGVLGPRLMAKTKDGFELNFGTNHLGHFLLTNLLTDLLKKSAPSRIVVVASSFYNFCYLSGGFHIDDPNYEKESYRPLLAYCHSKLANILFVHTLHQRLNKDGPSGVSVFSLHPGLINTNVTRYRNFVEKMIWAAFTWFVKTPKQGAETTVYCATEPGIEEHSGKYFQDSHVQDVWPYAKDDVMGERLWEISEKLVSAR